MDLASRRSKIRTSAKTTVGSWWRRPGAGEPRSYWPFPLTATSGRESAIRPVDALAIFFSLTTSRRIIKSCAHGPTVMNTSHELRAASPERRFILWTVTTLWVWRTVFEQPNSKVAVAPQIRQ